MQSYEWQLFFLVVGTTFVSTLASLCDFNNFSNGCEDEIGAFCNQSTQQCQCKPGYPVRVNSFCLLLKNVTQSCYLSKQCRQLPKSYVGCYDYDFNELNETAIIDLPPDQWSIGKCLCSKSYFLRQNECFPKKENGERCDDSTQCLLENSFCDNTFSAKGKCKCRPGYIALNPTSDKCVQMRKIGEMCKENSQCQLSDINSECVDNLCQCRSGYMMNWASVCIRLTKTRTRDSLYQNTFMIIVVVGTAIIFGLLCTAHRRWTTPVTLLDESLRSTQTSQQYCAGCRMHPRLNSLPSDSFSSSELHSHSPSIAVIWPLQRQNLAPPPRYPDLLPQDNPPSYAEAMRNIEQSSTQQCSNNT